MRIRGLSFSIRGALAVVAASFVSALAVAPAPAAALAGPAGSCAWYVPLNTSGANSLFLDQDVTYWVTRVPYTPGQALTLRGQYPHARYMSVTAYDPRTRAVSSLYDAQIQPDAGSTNPFAPGAPRNAPSRAWTVHVAFLQPGQQPSSAPNTLSTGFTAGATSVPATDFFLVYRVYLPDRGRDAAGGVPLPAVSVTVPVVGEQPFPSCPAGAVPPSAANDAIAAAGAPSLPPDPSSPRPAWHRFYNFPTSAAQAPDSTGKTSFAGQVTPFTMKTGQGGYLEDLENAYLYAFVNQGAGPITVIHAQALTYPDTFGGAATMPAGGDVRYWSVCSYDPASQRNLACLPDFQAAPQGGQFTIVVSTPANRPADLCGATWLPFGPNLQSLLIFRNQLGTAPYTIQNVALGRETAMGPYYPATQQMDAATYRHQVCGISDAPAPSSVAPADLGSDGAVLGDFGLPAFDGPIYGDAGPFAGVDLATDEPPADAAPPDAAADVPADALPMRAAARLVHANPALALALGALVLGVLGVAVRRRLSEM